MTAPTEKRKPLSRRDNRAAPVRSPINAGDRFGRWTVLRTAGRTASRNARLLCRCDCGQQREVKDTNLRNGQSMSCGCALRERMSETAQHGHCSGGSSSPEYRSWSSMKARCNNPTDPSYADYGERGIVVCERWISGEGGRSGFECFLIDMGPRPSLRHSIDRRDPNGPYTLENCRWATTGEQGKNKRTTPRLTMDGVTRTIHEWALIVGISRVLLASRKRAGWSDEDALTQPLRQGSRPRPPVEIGKRRRLTKPQVLQLALDQSGRCACGCGEKLDAIREGIVDEHVIPLGVGGSNDLTNRRLYRRPCAAEKTRRDLAAIAKAKRLAGETCQGPTRPIPQHAEPWPTKGSRPMQSRGFPQRYRRET